MAEQGAERPIYRAKLQHISYQKVAQAWSLPKILPLASYFTPANHQLFRLQVLPAVALSGIRVRGLGQEIGELGHAGDDQVRLVGPAGEGALAAVNEGGAHACGFGADTVELVVGDEEDLVEREVDLARGHFVSGACGLKALASATEITASNAMP